jgi:hypothetical protein
VVRDETGPPLTRIRLAVRNDGALDYLAARYVAFSTKFFWPEVRFIGEGGCDFSLRKARFPLTFAYIRHEITTGTAVAEIAKEFGVNKTSIYAFMKKHQIPLPNPQQRTFCPDSPRVHVAYAELKSIRKAAAAVGLEFWRVNYILKHFNPDGTRR